MQAHHLQQTTISLDPQEVFDNLEKGFVNRLENSVELKNELSNESEKLNKRRKVLVAEIEDTEVYTDLLYQRLRSFKSLNGDSTNLNYENQLQEIFHNYSFDDLQNKRIDFAEQIGQIDERLNRLKSAYKIETHMNPIGKKIGCGPFCRSIKGGLISFFIGVVLVLSLSRKKVG